MSLDHGDNQGSLCKSNLILLEGVEVGPPHTALSDQDFHMSQHTAQGGTELPVEHHSMQNRAYQLFQVKGFRSMAVVLQPCEVVLRDALVVPLGLCSASVMRVSLRWLSRRILSRTATQVSELDSRGCFDWTSREADYLACAAPFPSFAYLERPAPSEAEACVLRRPLHLAVLCSSARTGPMLHRHRHIW